MTSSAVLELSELLTRIRYLLLDFDGPTCAVFAGRPSRAIVVNLLRILAASDVTAPAHIADTSDPFEVLRYATTVGTPLAHRIEDHLRAAEVDATRTAKPAPHARELIDAWRRHGRLAAIVSNNSSAAVAAYLAAHHLYVDLVVGRTSPDATLLKPSPHLDLTAMRALGDHEADSYVLVGDSVTDIVAAHHAGIHSIGYSNAPGKHQALSHAGADIVIDDLATLSQAATASS